MAVTLSVQIKNATLVRKGLQDLDADIPRIGAETIFAAMQKAQRIMQTPGKKIGYPVNWDSQKQRRAYFATNGFGAGIPYRRTGAYEKSWYIRRNPRGQRKDVGYSLISNSPAAKWVGGSADGTGQSWIHFDRWSLVREAVERAFSKLPQEIESHIQMTIRRRLG